MRKVLLSILIVCLGLIPGHASNIVCPDGYDKRTFEEGNIGNTTGGRPLTYSELCARGFIITYDPFMYTLNILISPRIGYAFVSLSNPYTGEPTVSYLGSSTRNLTISPFTEGPGYWRFGLFSAHGGEDICCYFYFTIENGEICIYEH